MTASDLKAIESCTVVLQDALQDALQDVLQNALQSKQKKTRHTQAEKLDMTGLFKYRAAILQQDIPCWPNPSVCSPPYPYRH